MENFSQETTELLARIDRMKEQIEALQPISKEQSDRIFQKYRLDWNYHSNSIEGNSLNYGETVAFLMEGLTAKGKPLKDHLDIKGHNQAIEFLLDMQKHNTELTERDIRSLHEMILVEPYQSIAQTDSGQETTKIIRLGQYKSSPNHVRTATGETHYYATPEETPALMHDLIQWYRENRSQLHPLVLSALFHHRFVNIHPFDDGNGRMTRLLSNLLLMKADFPPLVIRQDQRREYYGVLSQADAGIIEPLIQFFAERLIASLDTYLRGARGEDIADPTDLEKEIALFVAGFNEEDISKEQLSEEIFTKMLSNSVISVLKNTELNNNKIGQLFFDNIVSFRTAIITNDTGAIVSEYAPTTQSHFYKNLVGGSTLNELLVNDFKKSYKKDTSFRVLIDFIKNGFKAKDSVKTIKTTLIFDFSRASYRVGVDSISSVDEKYSYPRPLTKDTIQNISSKFFKEMMRIIQTSVQRSE